MVTRQKNGKNSGKPAKAPVRRSTSTARLAAMTPLRLRQAYGVSRRVMSRLSGFSERAIADWEAGKPLSRTSQQRMSELQRLRAGLARVMNAEVIAAWLETPNDKFSGLKPLEVVERGEIDRLWQMIYYLESGSPG